MTTLAEVNTELAQIETALAAIYGGAQSYSIAGRSVTRAALKDLLARKNLLQRMASRLATTNGGAITNPIFGSPSTSGSD